MAFLNKYETEFFAFCPVNRVRIKYNVAIETNDIIAVEDLLDHIIEYYGEGWHEHIADDMHEKFGGRQTLTADHHSVKITTYRGAE